MKDPIIEEYIRIKNQRGLSTQGMADILGINADALEKYESGMVLPSYNFVKKVREHLKIHAADSGFENIVTQGCFGNIIPLITEYDLITNCDNHVVFYMELPQLNEYKDKLFAMCYKGESVPEYGILPESVLVFTWCDNIDRDGVYAVVSRGALKFKKARLSDGMINVTPLDGKRHLPNRFKSASAKGRLVCCVNTYK